MNLAILLEWNSVDILLAVGELCTPNATYAYRNGVDKLLVVDDGEAIALLNAEEVDGPLVDT